MGNIKAKTHLEKLGFSEPDKKKPTHDKIQTWVYENIETVLKETVMKNNEFPYKITENKWEHQIIYTNGSYKTVVGFVDIFAKVDGIFFYKSGKEIIKERTYASIFIEIKTEIPSLGELIRQLRAYQSYEGSYRTYYVVVSPDDSHIKILKEQGFYFYKYKDPALLF
jgi:hypothetical protein